MTILEQIAVKMGWETEGFNHEGEEYIYDEKSDLYISFSEMGKNTLLGSWFAKLLQAKMVEDDHKIHIVHYPAADAENRPGKFECWASPLETYSGDPGGYEHSAYAATEPAALVELFKKVYGIKEGA